jgi:hypothetical protein
VKPLDVEVPVVPPLDCRLPPIEFGFVVNPLDVDVVGVPAGVTMSVVPDGPVVVVVVGLGVAVGGVAGVDPTTPVVGSVRAGEIAVGGSAGVVGVTGGITAIGGAARGVTMSLLRTQSGPLRSMQAGTASGTLRVRSVDCASADAEAVNSTSSDAEVSFISSP